MISELGRAIGLALCGLLGAATARAQTPPPAEQQAPSDPDGSNVVSYPPSFFDEFQPNTALDMVQRLPGFVFDNGTSARGFSGTSGNVLIEGERPPSRADNLSAILSRIPAGSVARIDIITGGSGAIDLQGRTVVANVIRKKTKALSGSATASLAEYGPADLTPGLQAQAQQQSGDQILEGALSYRYFNNEGNESDLRLSPAGDVLQEGEQTFENHNRRVEGSGAWETTLFGGKLRVNGEALDLVQHASTLEPLVVPEGAVVSGSEVDRDSGEVGLRYARNFSSYNLELNAFQSLSRTRNNSFYDDPTTISGSVTANQSGESIVRATMKAPRFDNLSIEAGAETAFNFLHFDASRTLDGNAFELAGDASKVQELRSEAFTTATWAPSKRLTVEAGARFEWSDISAEGSAGAADKTLEYLKPRLNVSWAPEDGMVWGARIERRVDQLDFNSFLSSASFAYDIYRIGNPDVVPASAWDYELRFERHFGGKNSFTIKYVHTGLQNVIDQVAITSPPTAEDPGQVVQISRNVGSAGRDEVDLGASMELDRYCLKGGILGASLSYQTSTYVDPVTFQRRILSSDRPLNWNINLSRTMYSGVLRWSISVNNNRAATYFAPLDVQTADPGNPSISASLTWKPAVQWTLTASAGNIFETHYQNDLFVYDLPRDVGAPLYSEHFDEPSIRNFQLSVRRNF